MDALQANLQGIRKKQLFRLSLLPLSTNQVYSPLEVSLFVTIGPNRWLGPRPKIGIRPTIDGQRDGVRESLEEQTVSVARGR